MSKLFSTFRKALKGLVSDEIHKVPIKDIQGLMVRNLVKDGEILAKSEKPHITATRILKFPYAKKDSEIIDSLRKTIRDGKIHKIPPVEIFKHKNGDLYLLNGHHRLAAHRLEGLNHISAIIKEKL